jgi:carbon monoxide dehydrogenase subunit G
MHLEGNHTFEAPLQAVWDTLLNPAIIAQCIPGKEKFEQVGPDLYEVAMRVKVGPITGSGTAQIRLSDQEPPYRYRMSVDGGGAIGHIRGSGVMTLSADGNRTVVAYSGDADVTGRVASVGQRLLGVTAKLMISQFFKCMEGKIGR